MVNFTTRCGIIVQFLVLILLTLVSQLACSSSNSKKEFIQEYEKVQVMLVAQEYAEALPMAQVLKERSRKQFGEGDVWFARSTMALAGILVELRSLDSAEANYRQAIKTFEALPDRDETGLFLCYFRLGGMLNVFDDRFPEAEEQLVKAQAMIESGLRIDYLRKGLVQFQLAKSYKGQGKLEEALVAIERALATMLQDLGMYDHALLPVLKGYADLARQNGMQEKSDSVLRWIDKIPQ